MTQPEPLSTRKTIIVLGDLITDIVVRPGGPIYPGSDTTSAISVHAGGSAANQAAWLGAVAGDWLAVHFVGRVGSDLFGDYHEAELKRLGIQTHLSRDSQRPTGSIVVLVDPATGERSMLTERGANLALSPADLPENLFEPGACLHLSGYSLLEDGPARQTALTALELAHSCQMLISVDPASVSLLEKIGPRQFLDWTAGADLCFPNLDEGHLLSGEQEPAKIVARLLDYYKGVALKLGADGAIWGNRDNKSALSQASTPDVTCVDTTGAGDAFCAGFLAAWFRNQNAEEALAEGNRLGALAVSRPGARPG